MIRGLVNFQLTFSEEGRKGMICVAAKLLFLRISRRRGWNRENPQGVKGSVCQGWVVDWANTALEQGQKGGVVSTPLPIKLLSLASPSRYLDSKRKGGFEFEEWMLQCSRTGQAQHGLSCKAAKCSDAGTGDLGVLPTHEWKWSQCELRIWATALWTGRK